jgi:hypothetical protein
MCEIITVEYILWCKKNMIRPKTYDRAVLKSLFGGM